MKFKNILALSVIALMIQSNLVRCKFPDKPKPCKYEDRKCVADTIHYLLHEKKAGDNSLNLIATDPLKITKINLQQGGESPVNIDLTFTDNELFGLSNNEVYKVKSFGMDLKQKHEIHLKFRSLQLIGAYKINGRVLILPISGVGRSNLTVDNADFSLQFNGEPFLKDGATYMRPTNVEMTLDPERVHYYFGNLFNGDKLLGETMNLFLNDNWLDIYNEIRGVLVEAFAKIFENIISNVFEKYSYAKYFKNE